MSGQEFPINLSGILVAARLVLAALLNQPPQRSDRPPAAKIGAEPSDPFQDIPARIWEDPLEAVARAAPPGTGSRGDDQPDSEACQSSGAAVPTHISPLTEAQTPDTEGPDAATAAPIPPTCFTCRSGSPCSSPYPWAPASTTGTCPRALSDS